MNLAQYLWQKVPVGEKCHKYLFEVWMFSQLSIWERKAFLLRVVAVCGTILTSRLPGMIRWGEKLSTDKSAYNVHRMRICFLCSCQINPACAPGSEIDPSVWCQSALPDLHCRSVGCNSLGTAVLGFN